MNSVALIFDLDGTLVDSLPDLRAALNSMLVGLSRRELADSEVRRMIGDGTPALVRRALGATGGVTDLEQAHRAFLQFYELRLTRLTRLYPGVRDTLSELRKSGARLGVCTNKSQAMTIALLKALGIANDFAAVLGGDAVPHKKPNPAHLVAVIEQLGATPGNAIMVGDGENDYAVARALSIPVILMSYGYLHVPRESLSPDAWLDRFVEIPQAVMRIRAGIGAGLTTTTKFARLLIGVAGASGLFSSVFQHETKNAPSWAISAESVRPTSGSLAMP